MRALGVVTRRSEAWSFFSVAVPCRACNGLQDVASGFGAFSYYDDFARGLKLGHRLGRVLCNRAESDWMPGVTQGLCDG